MSELALQLIAENKAKHERGEDATYLDLGRCGLTKLPTAIKELVWVETLILSDEWWEYDHEKESGGGIIETVQNSVSGEKITNFSPNLHRQE